jgi:hypothetical protein
MRYVSKAGKERQRWMTLVEAINSITSKNSCDQREAVDDLFWKIADDNMSVLLGRWFSDPDSLGDFTEASRYDFQGEIKVCLDAPGYVRLDSKAGKTKYPIGHINSYAKVEIIAGPVVDIDFDLEKDGPIPDVNRSYFWPLLVSRDAIQKWPFVPEKGPDQSHSAPTQIPEIPDKTLSHSGAAGRPTSRHLVEGELMRRLASDEPLADSKKAEAESLSRWLETEYPKQPPLKAKSIKNAFPSLLEQRVVKKIAQNKNIGANIGRFIGSK